MSEHTWSWTTTAGEAWEAMLEACKQAKRSIEFEQYIFVDFAEGGIGKQFVDVFLQKAKEGVKVRLIIDAVGGFKFILSPYVKQLEQAGVEICFHKTLHRWQWKRFFAYFLRDHRKLVVIDGEQAFIGGVIVSGVARHWRDTHVHLRGPVARHLQRAFKDMWLMIHRTPRRGAGPSPMTGDGFVVLPNAPSLREKYINKSLVRMIKRAQTSIYITTPYFSPGPRIMHLFRRLRKRGVDVRILMAEKCDSRIGEVVAASFYEPLLECGVRIFQYPRFVHAKTVVVDGSWATVGSCNFDQLSFWFNHELNVAAKNKGFAQDVQNQFLKDQEEAVELDLETWRKRSWWQKMLEKVSYLARPFS